VYSTTMNNTTHGSTTSTTTTANLLHLIIIDHYRSSSSILSPLLTETTLTASFGPSVRSAMVRQLFLPVIVYQSVYPSVYPSVYQSVCHSFLSAHLPVHLSVIFVCLSIALWNCLCLWALGGVCVPYTHQSWSSPRFFLRGRQGDQENDKSEARARRLSDKKSYLES
jgi:hypothetical protein